MMIPAKPLAPATALLIALATLNPAFAAGKCSQTTHITNNSGIRLEFSELKSSSSPPFFQSQWTGSRVIAPGATGTINWTSDLGCNDPSTGKSNQWDVKLIRANKIVHYCGQMIQSQSVRVDTPDLCFPS